MQLRRSGGCALLLVAACGHETASIDPDAAADAGAVDANLADSALADAPLPDPEDLTPPALVAIAPGPGGDVWLHEPFRFEFDEWLGDGGAVTATVAGTAVDATMTREGNTVVVNVDPAAAGLGPLALRVTGVTDLKGNIAADAAGEYTLAPWSTPAVDRGVAASSPALAISDNGAVIAAWIVGAAGSRRLVVSRREGGTWFALGGSLGADATSPSVALDPSGIVVAWIENGAARAARWTGAWTDLPSPGAGSRVALAGGPEIVAATFGPSIAVRKLAGTAWEAVGGDLAPGGNIVGSPALALAAAGKPVVGWITQASATVTLQVRRFGSSWTTMAPIAFAAPPSGTPHMSLAARDAEVAIAWDQHSGSSSVYAARSSTASWTRLGRTLDIDVAGDASAPAIAFDATGAPIVAWRERVETAERGAVARWTSNAWRIVGGASWLASSNGTPTPTTIALHEGRAPVIGFATGGAVGVARWNGPKTAGPGMTSRPALGVCTFSTNPPARLLQTGCFTIPAAGKPAPHAGLVPYDIVAELWSDGAKKRRWIALPAGQSMTATSNGSWTAPNGTFIVKEFAFESTPGNPATRRAVETRFLVKTASGWQGFTYQWRANGSDADLLNDGQYTYDWPLDDGGSYRHLYPSRSQCLSCHHGSQGPLLGLRGQQLARWMDYGGKIAEQLPTLATIGVGPGTAVAPYIAPHDASASWEQRTRGYMAANCAHCHNPDNIAVKDLRYATPLAATRLCEHIVPGSPSQSVVYSRVTQRPGMPPLGTLAPDPLAENLLGKWISGMTSCP